MKKGCLAGPMHGLAAHQCGIYLNEINDKKTMKESSIKT
jgi:citrate synthase